MTYPFEFPPRQPGIYALLNRQTKQLYVGRAVDLFNRYVTWARHFSSPGDTPVARRMQQVLSETDPKDWVFSILRALPADTSGRELEDQEHSAIAAAMQRCGDRLINTNVSVCNQVALENTPGAGLLPKKKHGRPQATVVLGDTGESLYYPEAVAAIGCNRRWFYSRIKNFRKVGVTTVKLSTLKMLHDNFKGKFNHVLTVRKVGKLVTPENTVPTKPSVS